MLNLHFSFASARGLEAGTRGGRAGDTRGTPAPDDINRLQLFHGSVRGSSTRRASRSRWLRPSCWLRNGASQHAGQAIGDRLCLRVRVAVFVTVFVCVCVCECVRAPCRGLF